MAQGRRSRADAEYLGTPSLSVLQNVLEVPVSVREKMNTMEPHVKQQFLKNSVSPRTATGGR